MDKTRKILAFKSGLASKGKMLKGWKITGYYQSVVSKDGNHVLHMQSILKAPLMIRRGKIN